MDERKKEDRMHGRKEGCMEVRMDGWKEGWMDERKNGRKGRMDKGLLFKRMRVWMERMRKEGSKDIRVKGKDDL